MSDLRSGTMFTLVWSASECGKSPNYLLLHNLFSKLDFNSITITQKYEYYWNLSESSCNGEPKICFFETFILTEKKGCF